MYVVSEPLIVTMKNDNSKLNKHTIDIKIKLFVKMSYFLYGVKSQSNSGSIFSAF